MKLSRDVKLLILLLLPLIVVAAMAARSPRAQREQPRADYTSYDAGKTGTQAFYLVLKRLGYRVGRNQRPLERIRPHARAIILIEPDQNHPVSSVEAEALGRWVEQGNLLLVLGTSSDELFDELGVKLVSADQPKGPMLPAASDYSRGVQAVDAKLSLRLKAEEGRTLMGDEAGAAAIEVVRGNGRAVIVADPILASNRDLGKSDNALFLINIVSANVKRGEFVVFDEYHHGYMRLALSRHAALAYLQLLFAAGLALYSAGRRFGAIRPLPDAGKGRSGWEYIESMASLYQRAGARRAALDSICQDFRRELAVKVALPSSAGPSVMAEAAMPGSHRELERLLMRCDRPGEISDANLISLAAEIEEYRRRLGFTGNVE